MLVKYEPWHHSDKAWGIKIVEGKFVDTIISINNVELGPDERGLMTLDFAFINKTKGLQEEEFKSEEFNLVMEKVLNDIIEKAINLYDEDRDSNTTESSQQ